jgi:hypothetical protein
MEEKIFKFKILKEAIKAVPIMKYALAVLGLASVVSIIHGFGIDFDTVIVHCVIILVVMFLLLLIAFFANQVKKTKEKWAKILVQVGVWAFSIMTIAVCALFISSYFFKWPLSLSQSKQPVETSDNTSPKQQPIKNENLRDKNQESDNQVQTLNSIPDPPPINKINRQNAKVNPLKVSIICKRKEESTSFEVSPHVVLYTGDRIWFEITLPELGGYLLVCAKDSHGKVSNLFPGTKKAIKEGKYKFPYHLENYSTEVLKLAREESEDLPVNKLRIGGYTLDENTGSENIYFYYSNQRDKRLENYLKKYAVEVGKDITFKGFESTVEKYTPSDVNASISTPLLHYTETQLSLKHE